MNTKSIHRHYHFFQSCITGFGAGAVVMMLLLPFMTLAAEVDTSDWVCESCPFQNGYRANYAVGISHVSDDAARFGDATGYDEQGVYLNLEGSGIYVTDGYHVAWTLEDLGLDSRDIGIEGGKPGTYDFSISYREQPHRVFDTTSTIFTQNGSDVLTLPSGWTRSGLTSSFVDLDTSLRTIVIGSDRQGLQLGGHYRLSERFSLSADYRHEVRDGNDITGASFFTQASLLPRALDYQTDDVDLGLHYNGARGHLALGYRAGWFQNTAQSVTWEHPFSSAPGAERGRLAHAPDNKFRHVSLAGDYRFDTYDTVIALSGAVGQLEQHDALLPYTINANLSGRSLPRDRLDGHVDTSNLALTLTARPVSRARVRLAYRYDERDNKTPTEQWQRVIVDSFDSGALESNTPYSFQRMRLNLSTSLKIIDKINVNAGYKRTETDRDLQEVAEQTEDDSWGQVRWQPWSYLQLSAKGGIAKRKIDRYDTSIANSLGQNPLLRKYNLAYRYREYGELGVSADLPKAPVTLAASLRFANDDYSQSVLGLQESDELSYSASVDWAVDDHIALFISGGRDQIEAVQTGAELFDSPDWRATHDDHFSTGSAGLVMRGIREHTDVLLDYSRSTGTSEINLNSTISGQSPFPDLESELDALRLRVSWRSSERLTATAQLRYERFQTKDWALNAVQPDTIPTVLTLGADPYNYDVFVIGLGFRYAFNRTKTASPE